MMSNPVTQSVLPGGRGHRQITQNMPYKKIMCGEKLVAVKVAVSSNKVLWYKFSSIWKICVIFNQKRRAKIKKWLNPFPSIMFFLFCCCCALKYHAAANCWSVAVKASKMTVVFGECGRECLSAPGNTGWELWSVYTLQLNRVLAC